MAELLFQSSFFYRLHEASHVIENAQCLRHIVTIIPDMLGVIAVGILQEAKLRIHFNIEIALSALRHRF